MSPAKGTAHLVLGLDLEGEKKEKEKRWTELCLYGIVVLLRRCIYSVGRREEEGMEGVEESRMAARPSREWRVWVPGGGGLSRWRWGGGVLKQMAKGRVASTPGFSLFCSHPQLLEGEKGTVGVK